MVADILGGAGVRQRNRGRCEKGKEEYDIEINRYKMLGFYGHLARGARILYLA
jgi:hypothetical protein